MPARAQAALWRRLLNPFDLVVLAGAAVNVLIVLWLVGHWLTHG